MFLLVPSVPDGCGRRLVLPSSDWPTGSVVITRQSWDSNPGLKTPNPGAPGWLGQLSVQLDSSSGCHLRVRGFKPRVRLCADRDSLFRFLSLSNKTKKQTQLQIHTVSTVAFKEIEPSCQLFWRGKDRTGGMAVWGKRRGKRRPG